MCIILYILLLLQSTTCKSISATTCKSFLCVWPVMLLPASQTNPAAAQLLLQVSAAACKKKRTGLCDQLLVNLYDYSSSDVVSVIDVEVMCSYKGKL